MCQRGTETNLIIVQEEGQQYWENSINYYPWISDSAFKILLVWLMIFKNFISYNFENQEIKLDASRWKYLVWTQEERTSGFLKSFCGYFLGLIARLVGNAFTPKRQQSPLAGQTQPVIFLSRGPQVACQQPRLGPRHMGLGLLLNLVRPSPGLELLSLCPLALRLLSKIHAEERQRERDRKGPVLSLCKALPFYLGRDPSVGLARPSHGPGLWPMAPQSCSRTSVAEGGKGHGAV